MMKYATIETFHQIKYLQSFAMNILLFKLLSLDALSTNTHHGCTDAWHTPTATPSVGVNSATKSTNT